MAPLHVKLMRHSGSAIFLFGSSTYVLFPLLYSLAKVSADDTFARVEIFCSISTNFINLSRRLPTVILIS